MLFIMWLVLSLFPGRMRSDRFYIAVAGIAFACFVIVPEDIRASIMSLLDDVEIGSIASKLDSSGTILNASGY